MITPRVIVSLMLRFLLVLAVLLVPVIISVRWFEPRLAFFPYAGQTATPRDFAITFSENTLATSDGERIHTWLLRADQPRALVVYFHGNGGNLSVWVPIVSDIARHGFDVLAFDYRGYGLSSGRPTESGLYRDADAVLEHASSLRTRSQPVVYWGRSLGTAIAAYAATRQRPDGIILESGFSDARSVVGSSPVLSFLLLFSSYRFPTASHLDRSERPALVIHGDADQIVPFTLGQALFQKIKGEKTFVTIHGGDHNDERPRDEATYWMAVDRFVGGLAAQKRQ